MASTTTNYGLTKPVYSETADVAAMNTNMDKIDTALGGLDAGIAIVANGNTHEAINEGQYVYIRGHNSLAEGLYRATANIAANGTLSGTNVASAVMGTALAALSGSTVKYTDVIDNLTSSETSKPLSAKQGKTLSDQIGNFCKYTNCGNITTNETYTLTNDMKNSSVISLSFRRYGYCASITMPTEAFKNGITNGAYVTSDGSNRYVTFKVENGVLTILSDGMGTPIMEIVAIG